MEQPVYTLGRGGPLDSRPGTLRALMPPRSSTCARRRREPTGNESLWALVGFSCGRLLIGTLDHADGIDAVERAAQAAGGAGGPEDLAIDGDQVPFTEVLHVNG